MTRFEIQTLDFHLPQVNTIRIRAPVYGVYNWRCKGWVRVITWLPGQTYCITVATSSKPRNWTILYELEGLLRLCSSANIRNTLIRYLRLRQTANGGSKELVTSAYHPLCSVQLRLAESWLVDEVRPTKPQQLTRDGKDSNRTSQFSNFQSTTTNLCALQVTVVMMRSDHPVEWKSAIRTQLVTSSSYHQMEE